MQRMNGIFTYNNGIPGHTMLPRTVKTFIQIISASEIYNWLVSQVAE